jgi:hypothetical protein
MKDSKLSRYEIFVNSAIIAAEAEHGENGFRHRDVLFLTELFLNWATSPTFEANEEIQNIQIARYLMELVNDGYARKITKKGYPRYKLTRVGLIQLISSIATKTHTNNPNWFFFTYYFISSYQERVYRMIESEGALFPKALQLECEELFNLPNLVEREIIAVKKQLTIQRSRIDDSIYAAKTVREYLKSKKPISDAIKEISKVAPYDLDSRKPLSELISDLPQDLRVWELTFGNEARAHLLYEPSESLLRTYLTELEKISSTLA